MSLTRPSLRAKPAGPCGRAFTLIELILVMALMAFAAALAAPRMSSFFRGRAMDQEARRMLSLIRLGQSRAVAEGVPVLFWVNPRESTYGLTVQAGFVEEDTRASTFVADSSLTLEAPAIGTTAVSELEDERLGLPEDVAVIRFKPDGYYDEISQPQIIIRQGQEAAVALEQSGNRLRYEIRPHRLD
jgi:type II secretion system protein H